MTAMIYTLGTSECVAYGSIFDGIYRNMIVEGIFRSFSRGIIKMWVMWKVNLPQVSHMWSRIFSYYL